MTRYRMIGLAVAATAVLGGCGTTKSETPSAKVNVSVDPSVAAKVPAAYKGKPLTVGTAARLVPMEYKDDASGEIVGFDPELMNAIAARMGLKVKWSDGTFDSLLAGVQAGRFDSAISAISDTKSREQVVDFVTYLHEGASFYTPTGKANVKKFSDLCGHTVAMVRGFFYISWAEKLAPKCPKAKPLKLEVFNDHNEVTLSLVNGRADVGLADSPVALWAVNHSDGKLEISGKEFDATPFAIVIRKGDSIAPALQASVQSLIDDGTYMKILKEWGLEGGAITKSQINGATE